MGCGQLTGEEERGWRLERREVWERCEMRWSQVIVIASGVGGAIIFLFVLLFFEFQIGFRCVS
jgi:hypothetical protein